MADKSSNWCQTSPWNSFSHLYLNNDDNLNLNNVLFDNSLQNTPFLLEGGGSGGDKFEFQNSQRMEDDEIFRNMNSTFNQDNGGMVCPAAVQPTDGSQVSISTDIESNL